MNIGFVIFSMDSGGAERVVSILANKFVEKNHQVSICCFSDAKSSFDLNENISLVQFNAANRINKYPIFSFLVRLGHLYRCIKDHDIDTIVSFTSTMNLYSIVINLILNKKLIISERDDPVNNKIGYLQVFARKILYKRVDYLVVQNKKQFEYFQNWVPSKKLQIIYNPVIINANHSKRDQVRLVALGRLTPKKNHKALIRSFLKSDIDSELIVIGDGEINEELQQFTSSLDAEKRVIFMGYQKNVNNHLFLEDIYVSTSTYEGFPNALLESMNAGLACIHYNCPSGMDEIIEDGHNGFLVELHDEDDFAKKIRLLYEDQKLRRKFSKNAQRKVKEFDAEIISNRWLQLIKNI